MSKKKAVLSRIIETKPIVWRQLEFLQGRERIIFIGVRNDLEKQPEYPTVNERIFKVKDV